MNDLRRWATLLLALALLGLPIAGCATQASEDMESGGDAEATAPEAAPAAMDRMDELREAASRENEQRDVYTKHFIELGDALFERGEYAEARKAYANALELSPDDEDAKTKMARVANILGERIGELGDAFQDTRDRRAVKIQQARVQVESLWHDGQTAQAAGRYDEAIEDYERAALIVGVFDYDVDFTPNQEGLREQIAMARREKHEAEKTRVANQIEEARKIKEAEAAREKQERMARIAMLFRDANVAFENQRYEEAENFADTILAIDPRNESARKLRDLAIRSGHAAANEGLRSRNAEEWKKTFEAFARSVLPVTRDVMFPDDWATRHGSTADTSGVSGPAMSAKDQEITNILESTRVNLNFENTNIQQAIGHLFSMTGQNIVLDPKVREMDDSDLEVTVSVDGITAKNALNLITELLSLRWKIDNGIVLITTPEGIRANPVLRLYDVRDLVTPIRDFAGEEINLTPSGAGGFPDEGFGEEPVPPFETDAIVELIRSNVEPDSWDAEHVDITSTPTGTLIVKQSPDVHAKIAGLLRDLRSAGGLQVSIETRFLTVSDNFLQDIGVDLRGLGDQSGGVGAIGRGDFEPFDDLFAGSNANPSGVTSGSAEPSSIGTGLDTGIFYNNNGDGDARARLENLFDVALGTPGVLTNSGGTSLQMSFLDDTQINAVLRAVTKNERTEIVVAPKVVVYNNERANVTVLNQISYVYDFDVEIAQAAQIGDPLIQTIRDGVVLDVRPIISADRKYITMELRPTVATLVRPIVTFQTTLANGPPVTIQLPELQIQRVRTTVTMPDNGTLLLGGLKFFDEQNMTSTAPWIGEIPILSFFFKREGKFTQKKNLIILIKARIIDLAELEQRTGAID